jgi:16S rRNA (guanine527-N7)-methyltransferase
MSDTTSADLTESTLRSGLDSWGLAYTNSQIGDLLIYRDMLLDWNANRMNLTRIVEPEAVAVQHFLDSLSILQYCSVKQNGALLDVGTGAGFPALVLKIFRPDLRITLLEATAKKLQFNAAVCERLGLKQVEFIHGRIEKLPPPVPFSSFDIITVRAVAELSSLVSWCAPYLRRETGQLLALKGARATDELEAAIPEMQRLGLTAKLIRVTLPGGDYAHFIVQCIMLPRSRR